MRVTLPLGKEEFEDIRRKRASQTSKSHAEVFGNDQNRGFTQIVMPPQIRTEQCLHRRGIRIRTALRFLGLRSETSSLKDRPRLSDTVIETFAVADGTARKSGRDGMTCFGVRVFEIIAMTQPLDGAQTLRQLHR